MRMKRSQRRRLVGAAAALAVVTALAGCGTDAAEPESGNDTAASGDVKERATEQIEALYGSGSFTAPAGDGPAAQAGYTVAVVNSGTQTPNGAAMVVAAEEATDALGWDLTVYDGKFDPAEYQEGIRQAVAQNVDAIWLWAIDCPLVKTALDEAKQAGIPVIGHMSADCNDLDPEAESYFTQNLTYAEGSFIEWGEALGASQALWLLSQLGEDANVLEVAVQELVITKAVHDGFIAKMEELCPTCQVTTLDIRNAEMSSLQEDVATALLRDPEINGMAVSYEDLMTAGAAGAIMESGRSDSIEVAAGASFTPNHDLIRNDAGQDSGYVFMTPYEAWTVADMINRMFAGEEAAPTGTGMAYIDRDHGLPAEGEEWAPDFDFRSIFTQAWGTAS